MSYSIHVTPCERQGEGWIVRAYRDRDDAHLHSAEGLSLTEGLEIAEREIVKDYLAKSDRAPA